MKIEDLLFLTTAVEFAAAVMAIVHYRKYRASNEKYFLIFLWYTFLVDLVGAGLGHIYNVDNYWLYNGYLVTMYLFYFYWYYRILKSTNFRRFTRFFSAVFILVALASFIWQPMNIYHMYTFNAGALFVLILTVFHFYQLLNDDQVLIVKYKLSFWISTGLLLFSVGMIPLFSLSEYLDFQGPGYVITLVSLNVILYGCYIIGFIWTKKSYNHF